LKADFEVAPSFSVTLFESSQMQKNFVGFFKAPVAKGPPEPNELAHQAAHESRTHRVFFLRAGPTAGQHISLVIILGDELDLDFSTDRLPVALQQSTLMSF
jgi:hypothetical protein